MDFQPPPAPPVTGHDWTGVWRLPGETGATTKRLVPNEDFIQRRLSKCLETSSD